MMRLMVLFAFFSCAPPTLHVLPDPSAYAVTERVAVAINAVAERTVISFDASTDMTPVLATCGEYSGGAVRVSPCHGEPSDIALVHEFGHALGLGHSESTESIMFRNIRPTMTLEHAARSLVSELGGH